MSDLEICSFSNTIYVEKVCESVSRFYNNVVWKTVN